MSSPVNLYLVHMRFLISGFSQVWIRSESYHHNLRSTFTRPLLIVRFFLWLNEAKKNCTKTTKSCAFLINFFDELSFKNLYIFRARHPWWTSLQVLCFSESVNLRWSFITNLLLQEPNHLFHTCKHVSSSTILSNNIQNSWGQNFCSYG